jgi:hypothetical protein
MENGEWEGKGTEHTKFKICRQDEGVMFLKRPHVDDLVFVVRSYGTIDKIILCPREATTGINSTIYETTSIVLINVV